ncbi:hypothetical protein B566_EDAN005296 [Ephemera danica]|nr:hypothetical protein B566_EDAN005296 [Ephemera danica]
MLKKVLVIFLISYFVSCTTCKKFKDKEKPSWAKKDIRDYNDADLERLLDQWEVDMSKPENLLKMSKKGKTLMMFVNVDPSYSRQKTEEVTKLWQSSLWNNHIQAERYLIDDTRAIFMFKDGAQAWDAKDFLVKQEGMQDAVIENKSYPGDHAKPSEAKEEHTVTVNSRRTTEEL